MSATSLFYLSCLYEISVGLIVVPSFHKLCPTRPRHGAGFVLPDRPLSLYAQEICKEGRYDAAFGVKIPEAEH